MNGVAGLILHRPTRKQERNKTRKSSRPRGLSSASRNSLTIPTVLERFSYINSCGHFMGLIISDYVPSFLGYERSSSSSVQKLRSRDSLSEGAAWNINAFDSIKTSGGVEVGRGEG